MKLLSVRKTQFEDILKKANIEEHVHWLNRKIVLASELALFIKKFTDTKPDFFYFYKDEQLSPEILSRLKNISPKTKFIMFYGDQRGCVPELISTRKQYLDLLLINNEDPAQFKMYKNAGIKKVLTFHHGVPINEFQDFNIKPTHNILFGGNNFKMNRFPLSKFRYDFILRAKRLFPRMVVYGNGWPFPTNKAVPRHQYARALRTAKINLGMNHYDVFRYYDRRLFECMGSGRVHVTRYVPGMEHHFENNKHLVWFHTIKEGLNAIQNMLMYPEKREQIAAEGRKLVFEQHSFGVRAAQFRDILLSL